jgi:hypothetical protein
VIYIVFEYSLFYAGSGAQDVPSNPTLAFFTAGIIFNDLMNIQQRLIHNSNSAQ